VDRLGIQKQVLMFTAPGVQILDADIGTALARGANDQMAEALRNYSNRLAGLTVIALQDPRRAVLEPERGMTQLVLNGAIQRRVPRRAHVLAAARSGRGAPI
jgi:predicted TIM-barrel fold metal-dependent hydrolase